MKAAPWDDINFRFYFYNEVVYSPDNDFIFFKFLDLKKSFLLTFLLSRLKPKQFFYIPKHLLKDGYMFLQHWATCSIRRPSVGQTVGVAGVSPHVLTTKH